MMYYTAKERLDSLLVDLKADGAFEVKKSEKKIQIVRPHITTYLF